MKTNATARTAAAIGFRDYLREELASRCADNARYSLRAFAKSLGTDHSTLSQIIRGKRRLTPEMIRGLGALCALLLTCDGGRP